MASRILAYAAIGATFAAVPLISMKIRGERITPLDRRTALEVAIWWPWTVFMGACLLVLAIVRACCMIHARRKAGRLPVVTRKAA
jgi:hypothetical protein